MELDRWQSLGYFGPELALAATAAVVGALGRLRRLERRGLGELALLGASASVYLAARLSGWGEVWIFGRLAIVDGFAVFFEVLVGLAAVAVLWLSLDSGEIAERAEGEYAAWLLAATLGFVLMASAATLVTAYVAVELSCLAVRRVIRASRASSPALSPLIADAASSAAMIAAVGWLSGFSGSADYADVNRAIFEFGGADPPALIFVGVLAVAGFGYRVATAVCRERPADGSAEPGAPVSAVAFAAVGFATASLALWVRLFYPVLSRPGAGGAWVIEAALPWPQLVTAVSAAMMIVGGAAAAFQRGVKRLLAWASLANLGAVLAGTTALGDEGLRVVLFAVAAYALATTGAFAVAASVARSTGGQALDAYRGMIHRRGVPLATAMTLFLLSLAGLPPGVGFLAKLRLAAIASREATHVLLGALLAGSALTLVAYGRVMHRMFSRGNEGGPSLSLNPYDASLIGFLAVATIGLGVYDVPLADLARRSVHFVPW